MSTTSSCVIAVYEITSPSSEPTEPVPEQIGVKSVKLEPEVSTSQLYSKIFRRGGFSFSSSGSNESCGAYIARKLEALESPQENFPDLASHDDVKQSESERLVIVPNLESANAPNTPTVGTSANFFPEPTRLSTILRDDNFCDGHKKSSVAINDDVDEFEFSPAYEHHFLRRTSSSSHSDLLTVSNPGHEPSTPNLNSEMGESQPPDQESNLDARSTLAVALAAAAHNFR